MFGYPKEFSFEYAQELIDLDTLHTNVWKKDLLRKMQSAFQFNSAIGAFEFQDADDDETTRIVFLLCCDGDDGWVLHICTDTRPEPIEMRMYHNAQWMDMEIEGIYAYGEALVDLAYEIDTNALGE